MFLELIKNNRKFVKPRNTNVNNNFKLFTSLFSLRSQVFTSGSCNSLPEKLTTQSKNGPKK